jgi:hypothetical protein
VGPLAAPAPAKMPGQLDLAGQVDRLERAMNKLRTVLAVAVLAPMLAACAPKPEDVCDHVIDLMKKDLGDEADALSDEQVEKIRTSCVEDAEKDRKSNPKDYAKRAKCVKAAGSLDDLRECERAEKEAAKKE